MKTISFYCNRCGAPIDKDAFCAHLHVDYNGNPQSWNVFDLCAPCWYGYRNTFKFREGTE